MKKLFLFIFAIFLSGTCSVHAATVSFDSQTKAVGVNTPFLVSLILTSATPVNAVHIALTLPENVTVSDISNGNSIISFWTTTPHFDPASHTLTLEGIIPGGFSGTKGRLILLTLKASHPGSHQVVSINTTASNLYRNSANATDEPITAENLVLDVSSTNPATSIDIQDTFPPEHFAPAVIRSPGAFDNKWVVVFVAEDKGSGVDHYEVRETPPGLPFFSTGVWNVAESPYMLIDQNLRSTISVRAIDKKGNVRTENVPAPYPLPWYESEAMSYILIGGIIVLLFLIAAYRFVRSTHK